MSYDMINDRVMLKMIALMSMFKYNNIDINTIEMEYDLLDHGFGALAYLNGKLEYILNKNITIVESEPTKIKEAEFYNENGVKKIECRLNENTFIINNNALRMGFHNINNYYSKFMDICDRSMQRVVINARRANIIVATDDTAVENAKMLYEDMENDSDSYPGYIIGNRVFESIKTLPFGTNLADVNKVIEVEQYISAKWDMIYGLNSNYNMKRETLNESEIDSNLYTLLPLVDNMLKSREDALKSINKLTGGNATVELSSSWKVLHEVMHNFESHDGTEEKEVIVDGLQEETDIK